ncbi:ubiquitin carboxyl-terminal hydrolase DUB-1 [Nannizzia gypsea CBS 118893]|uniref:ubiquitinyl hydrolase 1 n=1 Tax=Arthroderma gypseum (strain ATCC MYA-4604 / CBS 118893) TaxID=535722 RepID=E4UZ31_ARTGP|nr:ubiquitin carboxyl-terminal hydrolase DUB-1 [Nannizzia gypsea CBS 118893]EFR03361.1 ubiquitin carboxyl-terminal hydrolase DUB-1 [Nannizzia gypsea CBS 118893]
MANNQHNNSSNSPNNANSPAKPNNLNSSQSSNENDRGRLRLFYSDWAPFFRNAALVSRGLSNETGVLCYRNCILTTLLHQPLFVNWLMLHVRQKGPWHPPRGGCFACFLAQLVDEYWSSIASDSLDLFLPHFWAGCSQFWDTNSTDQQDCIEFLTSFISKIDSSAHTGDIQHIFQTIFRYRSTCQTCQHTKYSESDHSWVLGASPLEQEPGSLENCIQEYMKAEDIADYHCGNCNNKSTLHREMFIKDAPEVLIVQVTRFKVPDSGESSKVTAEVQFTEDLDLTDRLTPQARESGESLRYQLTSVIVHRGATIKGGHYMSYVKTPTGTWACLNDEFSCEAKIDAILGFQDDNNVPYVLIYNRLPLLTGSQGRNNIGPDATGNYLIAEGVESSPQADAEKTPSTEHGVQIRISPGQPQTQQSEKSASEAGDGLTSLFEGSIGSTKGSLGSPSSSVRWEGQPAEVTVQVTMGDMIITGAVKGMLERRPKRRVSNSPEAKQKPKGIGKSRPPAKKNRKGARGYPLTLLMG